MKNFLRLNASLLYWILVAPFRGQLFKLSPIFRQMVFIGVRATPMVALTAFSVGVTLAMQAAHSLQQLGAEIYVPDLVMVTLLREMGPVLIAVIVIGRSGSAVAAELGTMKVSEEIEALEVMAINPISYLIVPRFLAMLVMLPALTILGNYIGVFGGWAVCRFALDFNTAGYVLRALESVEKNANSVFDTAGKFIGTTDKQLQDQMKELRVILLNLKVISTHAKAITEALGEKPNRLIFSGKTKTLTPETEIIKSKEPLPAKRP